MGDEPNRWENVYQSKEEAETSWYEDRPQVSLDLIAATGATIDAAIVDVGAGASRLVDCLLEQGFRRITVLDLSDTAPRERPAPDCLTMRPSNGLWRTSWIGSLPGALLSGMTGLRSTF